jgi:hypothetical protein
MGNKAGIKIIENRNPEPQKSTDMSLHMRSLYERYPLSSYLDHTTGKEKEIPWDG